jgi:hypothetical protein
LAWRRIYKQGLMQKVISAVKDCSEVYDGRGDERTMFDDHGVDEHGIDEQSIDEHVIIEGLVATFLHAERSIKGWV